jgi:hypothetical protein
MNYVVTTGDRHPRESTRKRVCARNDNLSGVQVPQISERRIVRALDGRLRRVIGAGRVPRAGDAFGDIPRHQIWRVPRRHEIALARPASLVRQPRSGFAQKAGTLGGAFAELADGAPGESPTLLVAERSLCRIAMKRSCRSPSSAEVEDLRLKQTRLVSLNGPGNEGRVIHLTA